MSYEKKVQIFIGNHNRKTPKMTTNFYLKMEALFDIGVPAINKHLNNLYLEGEILREATVSKIEIVQLEG